MGKNGQDYANVPKLFRWLVMVERHFGTSFCTTIKHRCVTHLYGITLFSKVKGKSQSGQGLQLSKKSFIPKIILSAICC